MLSQLNSRYRDKKLFFKKIEPIVESNSFCDIVYTIGGGHERFWIYKKSDSYKEIYEKIVTHIFNTINYQQKKYY